ncbi:MAG: helix-turn-helix transcriptional regulator [Leptolyngbyaceae cyanobacterium]
MDKSSPSTNDKLPVAHLSAENIPQEYQFEAWRQGASPVFEVSPLKDPKTYACSSTSYKLDQLTVHHTVFDAMQFSRTPQLISGGWSDCITLQFYCSGQMQGALADGTPLVMGSDRISIQDFAHAYSGIGGTRSVGQFGMIIPRHLINAHDKIYTHYPMFSWPVNSPPGRLLTHALSALWQALPEASMMDGPVLASGLVGLLNGLLSHQWDEATHQEMKRATLAAMQGYLNANLHRAELGVESLCQAFYCSRATVYRLFQPLGGVSTYIRDQRLTRCHQELQRCSEATMQTRKAIARRWGFSHWVTFRRHFKQRYGVLPSEVETVLISAHNGRSLESTSYSAEVERVRTWLDSY